MDKKQIFNALPEDIQDRIKSALKCFNTVYVDFEYGHYKASTMCGIQKVYAPDHRAVAVFNKSDIYSEKEQIENYINVFHDYPANYTGRRDYIGIIRKMENERDVVHNNDGSITVLCWYGAINKDGNFELIEKRKY